MESECGRRRCGRSGARARESRPLEVALAAAELPFRRGSLSALVVENVAGLAAAEAERWIAALAPLLRPGGRLIAADATSSDAAAARVAGAFLAAALTDIVQEWPREGAVLTAGVAPAAAVVAARFDCRCAAPRRQRSANAPSAGSAATASRASRHPRRIMGRAMSRRWSLALGLSVLVHLALIALGLGLGARRFTGPVDIEITGMRLDEVKDLPLGGPAGGHGAGHAAHRAHHHAQPAASTEGTLAAQRRRSRARGAPVAGGRRGGRGADQRSLGLRAEGLAPHCSSAPRPPAGDRLSSRRSTRLLQRLPDRRDLLEGTDLDLFQTFDALLIATPHPLDPSVTFLAARHHLDDAALQGRALPRRQGDRSVDRLAQRGGRPVGERRPRGKLPPGAGPPSRDDRLIVLAAPGLAVVTPPAYRALLLAPRVSRLRRRMVAPGPKAPRPAAPGASPDGGAPEIDWATMLWRIDAEEGLMPPDGVLMVSAVDIFKTATGAGGVPPVMFGMEVPAASERACQRR